METNRLRQFKAVVETGGVLKASEILSISGGGLSKSMKALEDEIGTKLFVQKGRGIELTEAGKRLYERIPAALVTLESLCDLKPHVQRDSLRLVSFEVFTTYFLASVIEQKFRDKAVDIREAIPGQMESLVAEGHCDIGITYLPIPHTGVEFLKAGRIRMGIYGLKGAWKGMPLEKIPFVVPISPLHGTPSGVRGLDGWPEHLFERTAPYRVELMGTAIQLCQQGIAVVFLPNFIVEMVNSCTIPRLHLSEIEMPSEIKPVFRDVFLIHRRGGDETKVVRDLAKTLRRLS